jgi:hypothetical protein
MVTVLGPFRAIRPSTAEGVPLTRFLQAGAPDSDYPSIHQVLDVERRPSDRNRHVAHMRAAALLAGWRRQGLLAADRSPSFYMWGTADGAALAGTAELSALPQTAAEPAACREKKAFLEATGMLVEMPVLGRYDLPHLEPHPLDSTGGGSIGAVPWLGTLEVEGEPSLVAGSATLGACRMLFPDDAQVPVWLLGRGRVEAPPIGLLMWPWVEAAEEASR